MLLLPPKEGVVDNFHISSKFGDFRQCWEAWLQLPEAHVEVIKPKKGGWGREGGRERRRKGVEERSEGCQLSAWEHEHIPGSKLCVRISFLFSSHCIPRLEWEF